jgi:hypothetical protein
LEGEVFDGMQIAAHARTLVKHCFKLILGIVELEFLGVKFLGGEVCLGGRK